MNMTVGKLRSLLEGIDDELPVVISDFYGDPDPLPEHGWGVDTLKGKPCFTVPWIDLGDYPE